MVQVKKNDYRRKIYRSFKRVIESYRAETELLIYLKEEFEKEKHRSVANNTHST